MMTTDGQHSLPIKLEVKTWNFYPGVGGGGGGS